MSDERFVGVVVEPPVSVANGLLEAVRRLAGSLGSARSGLFWPPPEQYSIPLVVCPGSEEHLRDVALIALKDACWDIEEFAVQLAPMELLNPGPGLPARVVSALSAKDGEIERVTEILLGAFARFGLEGAAAATPLLTVACCQDEAAGTAVTTALETGRDLPVAGWLAGGLCAAEGPRDSLDSTWLATRIRFVPLRRLGPRRQQ
jgi:hypothetical protein